MIKFIILLTGFLITGCVPSPEEVNKMNAKNFSTPEYVGELNGKKLYRVEVVKQASHNHFVYFLDKNPVITINREEPSGKSTIRKVEVFIDGIPVVSTNLSQ